MTEIVLASASPRRQEILTLAGIPFCVCPAADEQAPAGLAPEQRVQALARCKAEQVAPHFPGRVTLGADTMVVLDGRALGKPRSPEEAVEMLLSLQGREHTVMTGVWLTVMDAAGAVQKAEGFTDCTRVRFFPMTLEEAREYVATGEPMDKAGAYGIQGRGLRFVQGIEGDFYTVMGLPGGRLVRALSNFVQNTNFL